MVKSQLLERTEHDLSSYHINIQGLVEIILTFTPYFGLEFWQPRTRIVTDLIWVLDSGLSTILSKERGKKRVTLFGK